MKLSVIIPCYNAEATLATQLEALARQEWSEAWEVVLIDNRCTDNSMAVAKGYSARLPQLRIVEANAQPGQPYALNVGVEAAVGESVAFCDADDEVGSQWLPAIGRALAGHEFVACCFDTQKLNPPWVWKSRSNQQQNGLSIYRYPPFLPHAGGGGLGVRRDLCRAMGGFDITLPLLHDTDFCWRLQLAGIPLHFVPEAVVHVRYRSTLRGIYRQARSYAEYNVLLYKRYRQLGMPKLTWRQGVWAWLRLLRRTPRLLSRGDLARWLWQLGWRVGRVQGSLRYRVWAV